MSKVFNSGKLPFVGRREELEWILSSWNESIEGDRLQMYCVAGDAGVGKSRLVEEIKPHIEEKGGVVLHLKVYPDTMNSLLSLLTQELQKVALFGRISEGLSREPLLGLQRLVGRRATLLIIEDIHLLKGEPINELSRMLAQLEHQRLAVLTLARPMQMPSEEVMAPYVVEKRELKGLSIDDIRRLMQSLEKEEVSEQVVSVLSKITMGNPLAIRSALRSLIGSEASQSSVKALSGVDEEVLGQRLRVGATIYTEGLVSHLTSEEYKAAETLSLLGEVFDRRTAQALLGGRGEEMVEVLLDRGVLVQGGEGVQPIVPSEGTPDCLLFTHTLLHQLLVEQSTLDPCRILDLLIAGLPFHTVVPFKLLSNGEYSRYHTEEEIIRVIRQITQGVNFLKTSTNPEYIPMMLDGVEALSKHNWGILDPRTQERVEFYLIDNRIDPNDVDYEERAKEYIQKIEESSFSRTSPPKVAEILYHRLYLAQEDEAEITKVWEDAREVVRSQPEIASTPPYIGFMGRLAFLSMNPTLGVSTRLKEIDRHWNEMTQKNPERFPPQEVVTYGPSRFLIRLYESEVEFCQKEEEYRKIDQLVPSDNPNFYFARIHWLCDAGYLDEVLERMKQLTPVVQNFIQLKQDVIVASAVRFACRTIVGIGQPNILKQFQILQEKNDLSAHKPYLRAVAVRSGQLLLLLGKTELVGEIFKVVGVEMDDLDPATSILVYNSDESGGDDNENLLGEFYRTLQKGELIAAVSLAQSVLRRPILRIYDGLRLFALLSLIKKHSDGTHLEEQLGEDIRVHAEQLLCYMALPKRRLPLVMQRVLKTVEYHFGKGEREEWHKRIQALQSEREEEHKSLQDIADSHLTVIGTMAKVEEDESITIVRGKRIAHLLGVLVADKARKQPLEPIEFLKIATGENDVDRGRNILKSSLFRLRELVGVECIQTREKPELNTVSVSVDLLEVYKRMNSVKEAMDGGLYPKAISDLLRCLEIVKGGVIYPGLYDRFFEESREDFEVQLRRIILRVGTYLHSEGDYEMGAKLLRQGLKSMPGDEEIGELLASIYEANGQYVEAERVRMMFALAA